SDTATINPASPDLTITKTHTGNPARGQNGFTYTLTVSNVGNAPSYGAITVTENPPAGMTITAISGQNWACDLASRSCTNLQNFIIAHGSSAQPITVTVTVASNAASNLINSATVSGGGDSTPANNTANDPTQVVGADLTITKTHTGDFTQGQVGARYTLIVANRGSVSTAGAVYVDEQPPAGAFTSVALSGTGWNCAALRCTRTDSLAAGGAYPPINVTVTVAGSAPPLVTNRATVSGGGDTNAADNTANDPTNVLPGLPDLRINKSHINAFMQGQIGATYTISVTNIGQSPTSGLVTVIDLLPPSLSATSMSGAGWACVLATLSCTRSDALAAGAGYPAITLRVDVAANAPPNVVNVATVNGGGDANNANNTANDPTVIGQTTVNVSLTLGAITFNRVTNRFQQTVTVRNNGGNLTSAAFVLDALSAGANLVAPDGLTAATTPAGSPYRELGPIPAGGAAAVTLQFTRAGNVPITYNPRVLGPGPR
ncbi:MAG: DUF11 domain-containing protein, partial [Acidobacteria bacterium]|nr:DUF11 domain-containing protein [Acidobacteriota bacterium]